MPSRVREPMAALLAALLTTWPTALGAQNSALGTIALGAQAIGLVRRVDPAIGGRALTEGYLANPTMMAHGSWARLSAVLTLDFEGLTLERGELSPGIWGEGYIDRRHPHTYLHEAVATVDASALGLGLSLSAGKGFAPFGTDDPMMRPFVAYPVNHHLAQILERAMIVGAVRWGPVVVDGGFFNGDEPESSGDAPNSRRFADSWAARLTIVPGDEFELQASHANVQSPEWAAGFGADQRKWSGSLRMERWHRARGMPSHHGGAASDDRFYGLVEGAYTEDITGGRQSFRFRSVLGEGAVRRRGIELGFRVEDTERPEEERLLDPFRSARPHADAAILGTSRFRIRTLIVSAPVPRSLTARVAQSLTVRPFVEVSRTIAESVSQPAASDPVAFFGDRRIWSISAGLRLGAGSVHRRMGRYGAAVIDSHSSHPE